MSATGFVCVCVCVGRGERCLWVFLTQSLCCGFGRGCKRWELISSGFLYYCHCHANMSAITGCGCVIAWIWLLATSLPRECKNRCWVCPRFYLNWHFFPYIFREVRAVWMVEWTISKDIIYPLLPCCWCSLIHTARRPPKTKIIDGTLAN